MPVFASLTSLADLTADHFERAATSSTDLKLLLARCAELGRPGDAGWTNVLRAIARLGRGDVTWFEGEIRAELTPDGDRTTLALSNELGFGIRERLVPTVTLDAPFEELTAAALVAGDALLPLRCRLEENRLVMTSDGQPSAAPPSFEIEIEDPNADTDNQPTKPPPSTNPHTRPTVPSNVDPRELLDLADGKRSGG